MTRMAIKDEGKNQHTHGEGQYQVTADTVHNLAPRLQIRKATLRDVLLPIEKHTAGTMQCWCTASTTNRTQPRLELEHTARLEDTPDAQWAARRRSAAWSWQAPARRTPIDRDESPAGSATNAIGSSSSAATAPVDGLVVMIRTGADRVSTAYPSRGAADPPPDQRCQRQAHAGASKWNDVTPRPAAEMQRVAGARGVLRGRAAPGSKDGRASAGKGRTAGPQ